MIHIKRLGWLVLMVCVSCSKSTDLVAPLGVSTFVSKDDFKQQLGYEVYPRSMAFDANDNLYIADSYRIFKITPARQISLFAGGVDKEGYKNGSASQALFNGISGIAIDSKGDLFVGEQINHCIRRVTANGVVSLFAGKPNWFFGPGANDPDDGPDSSAHIVGPIALSFDKSGNLYETEGGGINRYSVAAIRQISPTGYVRTIAGSIGDLYYGDFTSVANFGLPAAVAVGDSNNIYVTDASHCLLAKLKPDGYATLVAGSGRPGLSDGMGKQASFAFPTSIAYGPDKIVYVSDHFGIRQVLTSGQVKTLSGSTQSGNQDGSLSDARFGYMYDLKFNSSSVLYVADNSNGSIRRIRLK